MRPNDIETVSGRFVGQERQEKRRDELIRFVRQLLAAVVCQAVEDALGGDSDALEFMANEAPGVVMALGLPAACVERWREADPTELRHTIGVGCEENMQRSVRRRRDRRLRTVHGCVP